MTLPDVHRPQRTSPTSVAPDLTRQEYRRASPPLFASALLDRFTRAHPALPVVVYLPIGIVLASVAVHEQGWSSTAGLAIGGYVLWTLAEYWLARLAFHKIPPGEWGALMHWRLHGVHHEHPDDPKRAVAPPLMSLPFAAVITTIAFAVLGTGRGCAVMTGFLVGYLVYDLLHYHLHHGRPRTRIGRALRRRHMLHHFSDDTKGYAVSCPWWDHVFRTAPPLRKS
ncbi:sterol desaturase family protein [Streptomyces sp. NPDC091268]|uniref:sterol desaturase family protein n=1 Tax=Streptomyces sp. NPDC091268 TaxID=3365979 RepID=UPI00382C5BA8